MWEKDIDKLVASGELSKDVAKMFDSQLITKRDYDMIFHDSSYTLNDLNKNAFINKMRNCGVLMVDFSNNYSHYLIAGGYLLKCGKFETNGWEVNNPYKNMVISNKFDWARPITDMESFTVSFVDNGTTFSQEISYTKTGNAALGAAIGGALGGATGAVIGAAANMQPQKHVISPAHGNLHKGLVVNIKWNSGQPTTLSLCHAIYDTLGKKTLCNDESRAINYGLWKNLSIASIENGQTIAHVSKLLRNTYRKNMFKKTNPTEYEKYCETLKILDKNKTVLTQYKSYQSEKATLTEQKTTVKGIFKSGKLRKIDERLKFIDGEISMYEGSQSYQTAAEAQKKYEEYLKKMEQFKI